jgi:hypothetical protein
MNPHDLFEANLYDLPEANPYGPPEANPYGPLEAKPYDPIEVKSGTLLTRHSLQASLSSACFSLAGSSPTWGLSVRRCGSPSAWSQAQVSATVSWTGRQVSPAL